MTCCYMPVLPIGLDILSMLIVFNIFYVNHGYIIDTGIFLGILGKGPNLKRGIFESRKPPNWEF